MRIFMVKGCVRDLRKTNLKDSDLMRSVAEISAGLVDAVLGGGLVKKRIAERAAEKAVAFAQSSLFVQREWLFFSTALQRTNKITFLART